MIVSAQEDQWSESAGVLQNLSTFKPILGIVLTVVVEDLLHRPGVLQGMEGAKSYPAKLVPNLIIIIGSICEKNNAICASF